MCGVAGYLTIGKLSPTKAKIRANIAKGLLVACESRGTDSTGVFLINGGNHILSKNTCYASKFVRQEDVTKAFERDNYLMLGHTRQATTGIVNKQNAHPFIKENIVGVHNGIISNSDELAEENKFKIEVDSEIIFELLNKYNNDFKKTFKKIQGSASIAWLDKTDPKILYLVAHENPLTVAEAPLLKTIFFASEFSALDSILQASIGNENYYIWEAKEDIVYKINPEHKIEQFKVSFSEYSSYYGNSYGKVWKDGKWVKEKAKIVYPENDSLFDNKETKLGQEELEFFKDLSKKVGCIVCGKPLHKFCYIDELDNNHIYCQDCVDEFEENYLMCVNLKSGVYTTL